MTTYSGRVVVLGSANMDLVVRQPRWAQPGETIHGTDFRTGPGGKGLNQAIAAARAGADVAFLGALGRDEFGFRLSATLAAEGIDVAGLRESDRPTGIAQISVTEDGENAIVIVAGANGDVSFSEADRAAISQGAFLVTQLERPLDLVRDALAHARSLGVTTVLTPAPAVEGIADLIELTDLLIPNEGEALLMTGETDPRKAAAALSRVARAVVVTLGPQGVLLAERGTVSRFPAHRVAPVDTTGAGDTFAGVLVAWLAAGHPLHDAVRAATAAAAISVTRPGAADSMPARSEILAMLATA